MKRVSGITRASSAHSDERIKLTSEALASADIIKLYAWEGSFERRIKDARREELGLIKKAAYLGSRNRQVCIKRLSGCKMEATYLSCWSASQIVIVDS